MLVNNLLQEIDRWRTGRCEYRLEQPLQAAADESSCRLQSWLAGEDTPPGAQLEQQEEGMQLLEALAKLDPRQREGRDLGGSLPWTLVQIPCTTRRANAYRNLV
jgi:DNA-directed RNA polymerase specialized sigma24 family protein